jgi:hypothetical protein
LRTKEIILPKNKRTSRASETKTEIAVEERGGEILLRPARRFPQANPDEVAGCLGSKRKSLPL